MSGDDPTKKLPDEGPADRSDAEKLRGQMDPMYQLHMDVHNLSQRIKELSDKVDARLHDTRPIWESVQAALVEIKTELRKLDRKFDIVNKELLEVKTDHEDLRQRLDKLESKPS